MITQKRKKKRKKRKKYYIGILHYLFISLYRLINMLSKVAKNYKYNPCDYTTHNIIIMQRSHYSTSVLHNSLYISITTLIQILYKSISYLL